MTLKGRQKGGGVISTLQKMLKAAIGGKNNTKQFTQKLEEANVKAAIERERANQASKNLNALADQFKKANEADMARLREESEKKNSSE